MLGISSGHLAVLLVMALFLIGPERLPSAVAWVSRTARAIRSYGTDSRAQLREHLGPEFDELQRPLRDLREARDEASTLVQELVDEPASTGAPRPLDSARPHFDPDAT